MYILYKFVHLYASYSLKHLDQCALTFEGTLVCPRSKIELTKGGGHETYYSSGNLNSV